MNGHRESGRRTEGENAPKLLTLNQLKGIAIRRTPKPADRDDQRWEADTQQELQERLVEFFDTFLPSYQVLDKPREIEKNIRRDRNVSYACHPQVLRLMANTWARWRFDRQMGPDTLAAAIGEFNLRTADPENLPYQDWEIIAQGAQRQVPGHPARELGKGYNGNTQADRGEDGGMSARRTQKEQPLGGGADDSPQPDDRPRRHTMSDQKGEWRIVGQVATGFSNNFTVRVQPITWEGFLDRQVREEEKPLGPISLNLPDDPEPDLPGYRVVFVSEHGHESEMFISPDWTDDDDTTQIEQLTIRYTPEQCRMAETDAGYETMLRTRADGQENPGMKLLEECNIRVSEILEGDPWTNISQRIMEGEFRKLKITVTLETARQAANRHREAVASGTHGTHLLLRRQHEDLDYAIREYWVLIEDDSGPRLLGMIDNSPFVGITGMDVLGEITTPGQIVWNVCSKAESLPYMEEPIRPEPEQPEPTQPRQQTPAGETEDQEKTEETYTWRRKKNRLSAIVQGHAIRVKAATWGEFQEAIKNIIGPKVIPVTTGYDNRMLTFTGMDVPNQPTSRAPGCICTGARNGVTTILSFTPSPLRIGPGTETIEFFQEAMTPQEFIRLHRDQRENTLALRELLKDG